MEIAQETKTIITTENARKVLGEKGKRMTDKEIDGVINSLIVICDKTIDRIVNTNKI